MTKQAGSATPTRTCVGCGARDCQSRLIRLRAGDDGTIVAGGLLRTGRSAYVHASRECVRGLLRSKGLAKSLRLAVARPARLELMQILEERLATVPSHVQSGTV